MDFPDTPEAVALALLDRILEREPEPERRGRNRPEDHILGLYAACLAAAKGDVDRPFLH